jgi:hypothetical protein
VETAVPTTIPTARRMPKVTMLRAAWNRTKSSSGSRK